MIQDPEVHKHTLDNGLTVLILPFAGVNSVHIYLTANAGALIETNSEIGAAHLLEHVVFEGTKTKKNAAQVEGKLTKIGARTNANTNYWSVTYTANAVNQSTNIDKLYEFLADITINPTINQKDVDRERKIVLEELNNARSDTYFEFFNELNKKEYGGSRLAEEVLGNEISLHKLDALTLRKVWERGYAAKNFILTVVGNVEPNKQLMLINKYFGHMKSGTKLEPKKPRRNFEPFIFTKRDQNLEQPTIGVSFKAFKDQDDNFYAANVLAGILGKGSKSRFFRNLRGKLGIVYSCGCGHYVNRYYGIITLHADLSEKNIPIFIKYLKKELNNIKTKNVTKKELEEEKARITTNSIYNTDDPGHRAGVYADAERLQYKLSPAQQYKKYMDVTQEDIKKVANIIFGQDPQIGVFSNTLTDKDIHQMWYGK